MVLAHILVDSPHIAEETSFDTVSVRLDLCAVQGSEAHWCLSAKASDACLQGMGGKNCVHALAGPALNYRRIHRLVYSCALVLALRNSMNWC